MADENNKIEMQGKHIPVWAIIAIFFVILLASISVILAVNASNKKNSSAEQLELARKYIDSLDYEQAILTLQKVLDIDPKNVEAYLELVEVYIKTEEFNKADEVVDEAKKNITNPDDVEKLIEAQDRVTAARVATNPTTTPVPTVTSMPEPTSTGSPASETTSTPIPTSTNTPTPTATSTPEPTETDVPTVIPTSTPGPSSVVTETPAPTITNTPAPPATSTPSPTATNTPTTTPTEVPPAFVAISEANFPDTIFRQYVLENIDRDKDGQLSESEIELCTTIEVSECGIYSLKGVEFFSKLTYLSCGNNNLSSLDISKNTALTRLYCGNNNLSSLDVSKNTALEYFLCDSNALGSLDVSKNTALVRMFCVSNNLSSLDVSKNIALEYLDCSFNNLSNLDISKNTMLVYLWCYSNRLRSLGVSKNTTLKYLSCYDNDINSLDVSQNIALEYLLCENNNISFLDVSNNTSLEYLTCDDNVTVIRTKTSQSIAIDEANFPDAIFRQYVLDNIDQDKDGQLSESEIEQCSYISISDKGISNLQGVEYFTTLTILDCTSNNLNSLDVSNNTALTKLYCYSNNAL